MRESVLANLTLMATPLFPVVILGYLILQWVPSLCCIGAAREETTRKWVVCVNILIFPNIPERDSRVVEPSVGDGPAVLDLIYWRWQFQNNRKP